MCEVGAFQLAVACSLRKTSAFWLKGKAPIWFSDLGVCMASCSYYNLSRWRCLGFVAFTKLSFTLSSLAQPFDQMGSILEYVFVILSQHKAYAGRFQNETARKRTGPITKGPPRRLLFTLVRNRLCYHFYLYQTNESCSQSVSRRQMLLRRFSKSCLRVIAPNATEAERPFYERSHMVLYVTRIQLLASVLSSHVRFQILDSSYQF